MKLAYSGRSKITALAIAEISGGDIEAVRENDASVNWGRARANTSLNPNISNSTNKRIMRELFREHEVPMPSLLSIDEVYEAIELGKLVVGRPDRHSKGRGYWLCRTPGDVSKALRGTRKKQAATHFMEFVEADHEVRVHIFCGKSIRISEKSFFLDDNGKKTYTTIKPTIKRKRARRAAKKAVKALGLDFGAVDILATDDAVYVLEVNAAPGLGGTMPRLYAKSFRRWYERMNRENIK